MVLICTPLCCAAERELGEEEPGAPEPHGGEEAARPRPRAGGEPGAAPGAEAAPGGGAPGGQDTGYLLTTKYLQSPIQRQEVRSVIKKTQQETQETKREKVKQEAAVTIPVKNYRYLDNEPALCVCYLVSLRAFPC